MLGDACEDFDGFWDDGLCAAARARFRAHLADCDRCREELHTRMQPSVLTGMLRRPRRPERLRGLARTVRDVAPVVAAYTALAGGGAGAGG